MWRWVCLYVCEYGDVGVAKDGCVMDVKRSAIFSSPEWQRHNIYKLAIHVIGTSLSKPHTSGTALQNACVCLVACSHIP